MKKIISKQLLGAIAGCAALAFGSPVLAASTWTDLGNICSGVGISSGVAVGNTLTCGSSNGASLSANAFSTNNGATSTSGTTFATAALYNWGGSTGGGLGVVNSNEVPSAQGPHAIDNQYGTDAARLNFTNTATTLATAVTLTSVGIGWTATTGATNGTGGDTDFSILAWTGLPQTTCTGGTLSNPGSVGAAGVVVGTTLTDNKCNNSAGSLVGSSLLSTGWTLIGNVQGLVSGGVVNFATTVYSSSWLVTAYNSAFAGGPLLAGSAALLDASGTAAATPTYDAFKLYSVAGSTATTQRVPEPGSLALLGAGLLGLMVSRRRKQAAL